MAAELWVAPGELRLDGDTVATAVPGAEAEAALAYALAGGRRLRLVANEVRANRVKVAMVVAEAERATTLRWRLESAIAAANRVDDDDD